MTGSLLFVAIIFLAGAIVCVSIAKQLGLSSVIGYLLAGILLGPYVFGFIGEEGKDILHFAEFGVVVMLFLIGLDIEPRNFWDMRKTILGMGGLQVALTILLSYVMFSALGYSWEVSLVFAMAISLSSTAIAMQVIEEKGLMQTNFGFSSFSILLFQDLIVIFMLGAMPLLGNNNHNNTIAGTDEQVNLLDNLPMGFQTLSIIFSIVLIVLAGKYLIEPMLRKVAQSGVRELLIASAMFIVFAISFLMEYVGLSPALGAFLGGVVLSNSEFKHELESTLEPFKNLLLGLFFMAVGASINFVLIAKYPLTVGGILLAVIILKAFVLYITAVVFKLKIDQKLLLTFSLAQVGEFAFVLLSFAFSLNILSQDQMDLMLVITALSMSFTPILTLLNERLILPKIGTKEYIKRPMDHIAKTQKIILIGFGQFGSVIVRFMRSHGVEATILDHDSNRVDVLRKMGFDVYYGDATRLDLLEAAGLAEAKMVIIAVDNINVTTDIARMIKKHHPNVEILARVKKTSDAYDILNLGIDNVYREYLQSSLQLAKDALSKLGFRKHTLFRQGQNFIKYDDDIMRRMAKEPEHIDEVYMNRIKEELEYQEKMLNEDFKRGIVEFDNHWLSEHSHTFKDESDSREEL